MPIRIKVRDKPDTLCKTCDFCTMVKADDYNWRVKCSVFDTFLKRKVLECDSYRERQRVSLKRMEEMAWYLDSKLLTKGKVGFVRARDLKDTDRIDHWDYDDDYG